MGKNDPVIVGIKLWIVFLIGFALLGYWVPLSIGLGAIAGLSGALIASYRKQDKPLPPEQKSQRDLIPRLSLGRKSEEEPNERAIDRPRRGFFSRQPGPSFKSRRR
ncbi:hypothetical protein HNI00_01660 [Thermoleptolyngbya oregonensis NK1-22]|uniref:Uncharacterized protein n=1 Tax=Thermoleptolyngbya oregonensis NK1-22 TaxID=2547457 RepID=A0AA96Y2H6_9CYAN|nr:hypothetical protein [Thermoleptolyngbya oregonensis]WOB42014.1 hypothetical protein HNI00_01660 [Thermoleptolyngbya oregonensis NK1-22]